MHLPRHSTKVPYLLSALTKTLGKGCTGGPSAVYRRAARLSKGSDIRKELPTDCHYTLADHPLHTAWNQGLPSVIYAALNKV